MQKFRLFILTLCFNIQSFNNNWDFDNITVNIAFSSSILKHNQ